MNQQLSRLIQSISTALANHTIVLKSFIDLFRRFFFSWTITRLRILALWMIPIVFVFGVSTILVMWLTASTSGSLGGVIDFISIHPVLTSIYALVMIVILIGALYLFIWADFFLVRACLSYAQKQKHIFAWRKYLSDWTLHKAVLRFIIVASLGIAAYIVIAIFSTSLVLLGISWDSLDVLSAFIALVGVLILAGIWYSFAAHIMQYSQRTLWWVYGVYLILVLLSFLISAFGLSDIALISVTVNNQPFLVHLNEIPSMVIVWWLLFILFSLFLSYVWSMILFARQMEKPSSTWFGVFHRSYELSLGQRKKVLWIILPFWIALMYMTAILDSLSSASLSHHSYNAISRELTEMNQVNQDSTQSGAQKEVTDQDIMASYLIAGAFSGNSLDREIHPKVLELFQNYEPQKENINKDLFKQISPIIDHQRVGTLHAKTKMDQFPFAYYGIVYFFVFLHWILLSWLLFYTVVNGYLYLKKNHSTPHIHE